MPSCLRASAETGDDVDGFCRDLPRSQMSAICPFPSPWPSAPNVRFFANAAQVRRLGLIAAFARRSASQTSVLARAVGDAKAVDEHV